MGYKLYLRLVFIFILFSGMIFLVSAEEPPTLENSKVEITKTKIIKSPLTTIVQFKGKASLENGVTLDCRLNLKVNFLNGWKETEFDHRLAQTKNHRFNEEFILKQEIIPGFYAITVKPNIAQIIKNFKFSNEEIKGFTASKNIFHGSLLKLIIFITLEHKELSRRIRILEKICSNTQEVVEKNEESSKLPRNDRKWQKWYKQNRGQVENILTKTHRRPLYYYPLTHDLVDPVCRNLLQNFHVLEKSVFHQLTEPGLTDSNDPILPFLHFDERILDQIDEAKQNLNKELIFNLVVILEYFGDDFKVIYKSEKKQRKWADRKITWRKGLNQFDKTYEDLEHYVASEWKNTYKKLKQLKNNLDEQLNLYGRLVSEGKKEDLITQLERLTKQMPDTVKSVKQDLNKKDPGAEDPEKQK